MKKAFEQLGILLSHKYVKVWLSVLSISMVVKLNASTIHWITFINTDDPHIGILDKNAKDVLYERFINVVNREIGQYGYDYKIYDYYSGTFTPWECQNCITNLQCDTTDIIVFYYIGHGNRLSNDAKNSRYPSMHIDNEINNSIPLSWVHQSLKNKKAQLVLTIAMCSNMHIEVEGNPNIAEVMLSPIKSLKGLPFEQTRSESIIADAFLGYKGDMIVCSASPGQPSWGLQTDLGPMDIFTYAFVSCFEKMTSEHILYWPELLKEISSQVNSTTKEPPYNKEQTPMYDFDLIQMQIPQKQVRGI